MSKPKTNVGGTGMRDTWKLWRHCMCRHGWYPLVVAPFITAAGVLDIYSSLDCNFIRVNVGFTPLNEEWSESSFNVGFWTQQIDAEDFNNTTETINPLISFKGCKPYSTDFHKAFIQGDRAWTAASIMAYCSAIAGLTAMTTIWLMTLCPLPACFVWPGVLLPAVLIGFLAGGAKFFIFDSMLCTNDFWIRTSTPLLEESAQSCTLQQGAIFSIASICCFFICVCLIFYNVPEKRELDPHFGVDDFDSVDEKDLEQGPIKSYSFDPTMEMIPEDVPYMLESRKDLYVPQLEVRDRSIPTVTNNEREDMHVEDRDDENDGLEAVMTKIGIYLKESGSEIDFEKAIITTNENQSQRKMPSPEKEIRKTKSFNKQPNHAGEARSMVSYETGKSKHRDKARGKIDPTISKDEVMNGTTNKEENQCDISAITIESQQVGSTIRSTKSRRKMDNYRVY